MTWVVICPNGVRIGLEKIITVIHRLKTRRGQILLAHYRIECIEALLGGTVFSACGWLFATAGDRILGAILLGFAAFQDCLNYPLPLIIFVLMPALPKLSDIYFGALGLKNGRVGTRGCSWRLPVGGLMSDKCHDQTFCLTQIRVKYFWL